MDRRASLSTGLAACRCRFIHIFLSAPSSLTWFIANHWTTSWVSAWGKMTVTQPSSRVCPSLFTPTPHLSLMQSSAWSPRLKRIFQSQAITFFKYCWTELLNTTNTFLSLEMKSKLSRILSLRNFRVLQMHYIPPNSFQCGRWLPTISRRQTCFIIEAWRMYLSMPLSFNSRSR